ncbi:Pvstp1, partial [Plasmodium cynomolgi strain B]
DPKGDPKNLITQGSTGDSAQTTVEKNDDPVSIDNNGKPGSPAISDMKVPSSSKSNTVDSPTTIMVRNPDEKHATTPKTQENVNNPIASPALPKDQVHVTNNTETPNGTPSKPDSNPPTTKPDVPFDIIPYIPLIPVLVGIIVIIFLLSKFFGIFGRRKRRYKKIQQIEGKPPFLEQHILDHIEHAQEEAPWTQDGDTRSYVYRMIKKRQPRFTQKGHLKQTVNQRRRKTIIIDIHLEVLDEFQTQDRELTREDFLQIIVDEFMQHEREFLEGKHTVGGHSSNHDSWRTGSIEMNMRNRDEIGIEKILPWNVHGNVNSNLNCDVKLNTNWIDWIQRNKGFLEECKHQPWFHALKAEWKQEQHEYIQREYGKIEESGKMAESTQNPLSAFHEKNDIPFIEMQKGLWRQWVSKQHKLMDMYKEQDWFMNLLNDIEEKEVEEVLTVEEAVEVEVVGEEEVLGVEELEKQQLYQEFHKRKQLVAKLWMLILALVIEECEMEDNIHDKELYLDSLLQNLKPKGYSGEKTYNAEMICESNDIFEGNKNNETDKYKNEEWFSQLNDDFINNDDNTYILSNKNDLDKPELVLENDNTLYNDTNKIPKDVVQMESTENTIESDFLNVSTSNERKFVEAYK